MNQTATATILEEMELFGAHPTRAEDDRDYPHDGDTALTIDGMMIAFADLMTGTPLEGDIPDLLWGFVSTIDRKLKRTADELGDRQAAIRECLSQQDGSEVLDVQLQEHTVIARKLETHEQAYETMREYAAARYLSVTGQAWRPARGSMVQKKTALASVIEARELLDAQAAREHEGKIPDGTRIGFAGSPKGGNIEMVEAMLDKVREKYPDMILLHSGYGRGDDKIASNWAGKNQVTQVLVPMDFGRWGSKRAGFKRNEAMIALKPTGMVILPGNGVTENLRDRAHAAGINTLSPRPVAA